MPTRADIQAATPRCPRRASSSQLHPTSRLQPNNTQCYTTLKRTRQVDAVGRPIFTDWYCPHHGVIHGSDLQPVQMVAA